MRRRSSLLQMTLRLTALTAVILTMVAGCGRGADSSARASVDPGPPPAELAGGENRFNRNCARCHGALGRGTNQGPPLVHIIYEPSHHADESFRRAVALGVPAHHWSFGPMPPIRTVSADDIESIISYVRWLQQKAGIE